MSKNTEYQKKYRVKQKEMKHDFAIARFVNTLLFAHISERSYAITDMIDSDMECQDDEGEDEYHQRISDDYDNVRDSLRAKAEVLNSQELRSALIYLLNGQIPHLKPEAKARCLKVIERRILKVSERGVFFDSFNSNQENDMCDVPFCLKCGERSEKANGRCYNCPE